MALRSIFWISTQVSAKLARARRRLFFVRGRLIVCRLRSIKAPSACGQKCHLSSFISKIGHASACMVFVAEVGRVGSFDCLPARAWRKPTAIPPMTHPEIMQNAKVKKKRLRAFPSDRKKKYHLGRDPEYRALACKQTNATLVPPIVPDQG